MLYSSFINSIFFFLSSFRHLQSDCFHFLFARVNVRGSVGIWLSQSYCSNFEQPRVKFMSASHEGTPLVREEVVFRKGSTMLPRHRAVETKKRIANGKLRDTFAGGTSVLRHVFRFIFMVSSFYFHFIAPSPVGQRLLYCLIRLRFR